MTSEKHQTEPISSPQAEFDLMRFVSPETPCPYLPGLKSRNEVYFVEGMDGATYEAMMGRGFRRSGRIVYRPRCRGCNECRQLRVPVREFARSRSMRRIWRANADLRVKVDRPEPTNEKYDLFVRYLEQQHDGTMSRTWDTFHDFLYDSPLPSREFSYYLGDRLVASAIADECPNGLSSVYMYFDPDHSRRSLGTYSILWEIEHCRAVGLEFYYLGYYVAGSRTMAYKARFRPNQVLVSDHCWLSFRG